MRCKWGQRCSAPCARQRDVIISESKNAQDGRTLAEGATEWISRAPDIALVLFLSALALARKGACANSVAGPHMHRPQRYARSHISSQAPGSGL